MATKSAAAAASTSAPVNAQLAKQVNIAQNKRKEFANKMKAEEQVTVQGSPFYRPYFGNNMPIQVNGVSVYVPLDGKPYTIPATFAGIFQERLSRIDALIQKQTVMSNFVEEAYAGEVDLLGQP